ncbi:CAP domain-containing protein [Natronomonas amylolytica]|uniref:CAP domain-containing protein n=1 Tax=Natronomonas amylolytica TaxID=3108498 RepID=UPI0030083010
MVLNAAIAGCTSSENRPSTETASPKPLPEITPSKSEYFPDVEIIEKTTHMYANKQRVLRNYERVAYEEDLAKIARIHSNDMAKRDFIGHDNPDGESHGDRLEKYGYDTHVSSEIITTYTPPYPAKTSIEEVAKYFVDSWMDSPPHRSAILDEDYVEAGVGVCVTSDDFFYATMLFSGRDTEIDG